MQGVRPGLRMIDRNRGGCFRYLPQLGSRTVPPPRPRVAEPDGGQHMKWRIDICPVDGGNADQDVVAGALCVLYKDVEVAVVREDAGIGELELGVLAAAATILLDEL